MRRPAARAGRTPPPDDPRRLPAGGPARREGLGRGRMGLRAQGAGGLALGHAAGRLLAVPAARRGREADRPSRREVSPGRGAGSRRAPAARCAGRPDRGRARAHAARQRHGGDAAPVRDRAPAGRAPLLGQPRSAHAARLDHRRRVQPDRGGRRPRRRRPTRAWPRRSSRKANGSTATSRTFST